MCFVLSRLGGVTATSHLSLSVHTHNIVAKAHQRSNAMYRCLLSRNVSLLTRAFLVYVRPLIQSTTVLCGHLN